MTEPRRRAPQEHRGAPRQERGFALPLYREAAEEIQEIQKFGKNAHGGLWYDKFCNTWSQVTPSESSGSSTWSLSASAKNENPKLKWLEALTRLSLGEQQSLREYCDRLSALATHLGGRVWVVRTEERFVTGLGRTNPVETGFAFHHTLGTPYLPGSSLKGLLRAAARFLGEDPRTIDRYFGSDLGQHDKFVGEVIVFDMIPLSPVALELDVMTPHYANWSPQDPPGDWREPTPIFFLTVPAKREFLAALAPRKPGALSEQDWEKLEHWLRTALGLLGAGAKTAVGYGRFSIDDQKSQSLRQEIAQKLHFQRAQLPTSPPTDPLEGELQEITRAIKDPNLKPYLAWLQELVKGRWQDRPELQRRVAERIRNEMQQLGVWKPETRAKKPEKDYDYQRTMQVMKYLS